MNNTGDGSGPPALSILFPLYNEQEVLIPNLRRVLLFLRQEGLDAEIILGSNGSTDATPEICAMASAAIRPDRIRFFHVEGRGSVGQVFKMAAATASSPVLVSMDMDLSVDLRFISNALELLGSCDLVVGSKKAGTQSRSPLRLIGSKLFILCANVLLRLPYDDYSIGAKAYRLSSVLPLLEDVSDDTSYVLDLLCRGRIAGLKIEVLPISCEDWRKSRFRLPREALVRFSYLFRLWISRLKGCRPGEPGAR